MIIHVVLELLKEVGYFVSSVCVLPREGLHIDVWLYTTEEPIACILLLCVY